MADEGTSGCALMGPLAILLQAGLAFIALATLIGTRLHGGRCTSRPSCANVGRWPSTRKRPGGGSKAPARAPSAHRAGLVRSRTPGWPGAWPAPLTAGWPPFFLLAPRLFDTSKQAIGQGAFHGLNIVLALALGWWTTAAEADACVWYFLSTVVDSTVGLLLLAGIVVLADRLVRRKQWRSLYSGEYGKPPRVSYWARQAALFVGQVMLVKVRPARVLAAAPCRGGARKHAAHFPRASLAWRSSCRRSW